MKLKVTSKIYKKFSAGVGKSMPVENKKKLKKLKKSIDILPLKGYNISTK